MLTVRIVVFVPDCSVPVAVVEPRVVYLTPSVWVAIQRPVPLVLTADRGDVALTSVRAVVVSIVPLAATMPTSRGTVVGDDDDRVLPVGNRSRPYPIITRYCPSVERLK